MAVKEAAVAVGLSRDRCYAILREIGRPAGAARGPGRSGDRRGVADRDVIAAVFTETGSVNRDDTGLPAIDNRYLSIADRVAIADGLLAREPLRTIAGRIGKNVSTVSREVRARSVEGRYLPYHADRAAAAARTRLDWETPAERLRDLLLAN